MKTVTGHYPNIIAFHTGATINLKGKTGFLDFIFLSYLTTSS